jgi:hypothetical protein
MARKPEPTLSERWRARRRHPGLWLSSAGMIAAMFSEEMREELGDFQSGLWFAGALALFVYCWRDADREAQRSAEWRAAHEAEEDACRTGGVTNRE